MNLCFQYQLFRFNRFNLRSYNTLRAPLLQRDYVQALYRMLLASILFGRKGCSVYKVKTRIALDHLIALSGKQDTQDCLKDILQRLSLLNELCMA